MGVRQDSKPQRLSYTGPTEVLKVEHRETFINVAFSAVSAWPQMLSQLLLVQWHSSAEDRDGHGVALLSSRTTISWFSSVVPCREAALITAWHSTMHVMRAISSQHNGAFEVPLSLVIFDVNVLCVWQKERKSARYSWFCIALPTFKAAQLFKEKYLAQAHKARHQCR